MNYSDPKTQHLEQSVGIYSAHGAARVSNHIPSKLWDEITNPFLNFNGCTVEV